MGNYEIFEILHKNGRGYKIWWYWNPKKKFHQHKRPIWIKNLDINKIVVCNKVSFGKKGFKYFIGQKDDKKIRHLCIFLPKYSAYRREFDQTKDISFLVKDDGLLENIMKFGKKLKMTFIKNLIVNQYTMKHV